MLRIDILVSDVALKRGTGFDVQVFVETKHPAARTLFVTGYAIPEVRGGDTKALWLEKPFTQDQLFRSINRLMNPPSMIVLPRTNPSAELAESVTRLDHRSCRLPLCDVGASRRLHTRARRVARRRLLRLRPAGRHLVVHPTGKYCSERKAAHSRARPQAVRLSAR
jgi:hypothetical protein